MLSLRQMVRRLPTIGVLTAALLATSLTAEVAVPTAAAKDQVPFRAQLAAQFSLPAPCAAGLCVEGDGSGNATHLGLVTVHISASFDPTQVDPGTGCVEDRVAATLTGASGDAIFLAGGGVVCFGTLSETGHYRVMGGSGRFQGASGSIAYSASLSATLTAATGTYDGAISSPGSLK